MNKYNIPDEIVEVVMDDFKRVFNKEPDKDRIAGLINHFGSERIAEVLERLFIVGISPVVEGKKDNPYGLLWVICSNRY
jgi:hypothetical protein